MVTDQIEHRIRMIMREELEAWEPPDDDDDDGEPPDSGDPITGFDFMGHGAKTIGGRDGEVVLVTHTADDTSEPGSLRSALTRKNPAYIIGRIGGEFNLKTKIPLRARKTFAGQTFPGSGAILSGQRITNRINQFIMTYVTHRTGYGSNYGLSMKSSDDGARNAMIDHCSFAGGEDDTLGIWYSQSSEGEHVFPDIENITMQNCIIAEPDPGHPTSLVIGGKHNLPKGIMGGYDHVKRISILRNLWIHSSHRNPRFMQLQFGECINNLVCNFRSRAAETGRGAKVDYIGNYYRGGPMTGTKIVIGFEWSDTKFNSGLVFPDSSIYVSGNISEFTGFIDPNADNWVLMMTKESGNKGNPVDLKHRRVTPLPPAPIPTIVLPGLGVPDHVTETAGNSKKINSLGEFVDRRDSADQKLIKDAREQTGPDSPSNVTTTRPSSYESGTPYPMTMPDGIPDDIKDKFGIPLTTDLNHVLNPATGKLWIEDFLFGRLAARS